MEPGSKKKTLYCNFPQEKEGKFFSAGLRTP